MWFTHLAIDATAGELTHDLAIDQSGYGAPSPVAAGLQLPDVTSLPRTSREQGTALLAWALAAALAAAVVFGTARVADERR